MRASAILRQSRFVSFDGAVSLSTWHQRPDRYRNLEQDLGNMPRIARGGGYSYAAASFGEGVVVQQMSAFNRLLEFDGHSKLRVEAGATLETLIRWAHHGPAGALVDRVDRRLANEDEAAAVQPGFHRLPTA